MAPSAVRSAAGFGRRTSRRELLKRPFSSEPAPSLQRGVCMY